MASEKVSCVIPCEGCENDNEDDYTFQKGFKKDSGYVTCDESHLLSCTDKEPEDQSVCAPMSEECPIINDDAKNMIFTDDCFSESVGSSAPKPQDEMKNGMEKQSITEQPIMNDDAEHMTFIDDYFSESVGSPANSYKDEMKKGLEKHNTEQPVLRCLKCNATGEQQFIQMLDSEGCLAWWKCSTCNEEYNQNGRLDPGTSQFKLRPCSSCQADDPNHFIIKECAMSKDIVLECGWCDVIHQTLVKARRPEVTDVECQCGNKKQDCFRIDEDAHGNITNVMCLVCDKNQDYRNESPITCTKCNNTDRDRFKLIDKKNGKTEAAICQCCNSRQKVYKDTKLILTPVYGKDSFLDKVKVTSCDELKTGDHIGFHRQVGYWHHAIVIDVDGPKKCLKLIEYTKKKLRQKICIQENWSKPIDWAKDTVHCIKYGPGKCSDPEVVLNRARQRIGEMTYNLLTNNCEHFAIWAKTGENASFQVQEYAKIAATAGIQWVVGSMVNMAGLLARINGTCLIGIKTPAICSHLGCFAGMAGLSVLDTLSCGIMVGVEIFHTGYKIYKEHKKKKKKEREIDELELTEEQKIKERKKVQHEFKEKVVDNVTQAAWQTACSVSGYMIFQMLIPVPILGGIIGGVIGAVIGTATRQKIGAQAVKVFNRATTTQSKENK